MNVSHASVHPVEDPPTTDGAGGGNNNEVPGVRMKDVQGMPGTLGGLVLWICQFAFAVVGLCVMATTSDFPSVTAFWLLSALPLVLSKHCGLSLMASILITSTLAFAAACASAGITVLIDNNLDSCAQNHCTQFETSTAMAFVCWFTGLPSFLLNFWSLASR
ncbi:hypothetical protein Goklo_028640 [Gossypium klotzschianum]|uniref:CASP-like protein n=1 Tax=Gossypium klotzschianum TaxID=34286 RepID=A0A7J8U1W8_9ROSI|nr:hypothetical protein [Gossypium klotzschianum]